jgi:cytochrome c556
MKKPLALISACAALTASLVSLPAAAQFQKPEDAIKYRQSAMALQGHHLGAVFAMISGRVPFDAKVAGEHIDVIATLNKLQFSGFVEGSDKGNTRAKPEIWAEKAKWNAAVAKGQEDVAKLVAAGKSGSLEQIKAAAGGVGQSCKACHDAYQRPAN